MCMSLVSTAKTVRRLIIFSILAIVLVIVWLFARASIYEAIDTLFPEDDPPNPIYGQLPPIQFQETELTNRPRYELNTTSGGLPTDIPEKITVYEYDNNTFSFSAGKNAQDDALVLGFTDENLTSNLETDIYTWRKPQEQSSLRIIINTRELELSTNLISQADRFSPGSITANSALNNAESIIEQINRLDDRLYRAGDRTVSLGKYVGQLIVETTTSIDAQLARVDFFRSIGTGRNEYPILGPDPKKGLIHMILGSSGRGFQVLVLEAYAWSIDTQSNASYPIISVREAWQQITSNNGVVSNVKPTNVSPFTNVATARVDRVLVNDIYIAYYDSEELQTYLQPVYVFEGNYTNTTGETGEITVYFPAIDAQYIQQIEEN